MIIESMPNTAKRSKYKDVYKGQGFLYKDEVYIKTDVCIANPGAGGSCDSVNGIKLRNSVNLKTGLLIYFDDDIDVYVRNMRIEVDYPCDGCNFQNE